MTSQIEKNIIEKLTGNKINRNNNSDISYNQWWKFTLKILAQAVVIGPFAGVLVWNLWAKEKVEEEIKPIENRVTILENIALSSNYDQKKTKMYIEGYIVSQGRADIIDSINREVNIDITNDSLGKILGMKPELLRPDKIKGE